MRRFIVTLFVGMVLGAAGMLALTTMSVPAEPVARVSDFTVAIP